MNPTPDLHLQRPVDMFSPSCSGQGRMLRVAQIVRPASGGMLSHVRTLVNGLGSSDIASTVYGPAATIHDLALVDLDSVPLEIAARTRPLADLQRIRQLARLLKGNADLVHAHGLRAALIGVWAARLTGIPAVVSLHNLPPQLSHVTAFAIRQTLRRADQVVTVSEAVSRLFGAVGIPHGRLSVIPNGIDLSRFASQPDRATARTLLSAPPSARIILAVGRLSKEKGYDLLVQAFADIAPNIPDALLWFVGSGPEEAALKALAAAGIQPVGERIQFLGRQADILPYLAASDVVAIPSRQEGQGIVAIEAMAAARPVVATAVGGLIETVQQDRTGLLVPSGDVQAFAAALTTILHDRARAATMGAIGREVAVSRYDSDTMVDRITAIYRATAPAPAPAGRS